MRKTLPVNEIEALVDDVLTRGVGSFVDPGGLFRKKLIAKASGTSNEEVIIKFGVDPTRPDIHLGHAVVFRKLRQFQDLGAKVIFLIGDFTARIGDPTGKSKVRPEVDSMDIQRNMQSFLLQVDKILLLTRDKKTNSIVESDQFSWIRNSDWYISLTDILVPDEAKPRMNLTIEKDGEKQEIEIPFDKNSFVGKAVYYSDQVLKSTTSKADRGETHQVSLRGVLWALRHITLAQLLERDMFQERIKTQTPLFIHEMLYPVLQGLDSTLIERIYGRCDLEVGGTDQTFNMLIGRNVMQSEGQQPQAVLAFDLLVGLDGKEKMSKSLDNYVGITDEPKDMFGKLMSIPDSVLPKYFELCTYTPLSKVKEIEKTLSSGKAHPKEVKMDLAEQIVEIYHGPGMGKNAREGFVNTFQKKEIPDDVVTIKVAKGILLADALLQEKIVESKSDFRRLLTDGAIRKNGEEKLIDPYYEITEHVVLKVGKHRFIAFDIN